MKNPSKTLALLLASAVCLTACGDKPAETATEPKSEPKPATTQTADPKPAEPAQAEKPMAQAEPTQNTEQAKPEPAKTEEVSAKTEAKEEVKALSIEEGKALYDKTCKVCHDQGLLEAPKLTAKADWAKRLEKGVDTLHKHSAKGFGKMPAQATGDVSEAQVYAAVDYMLSQVK